MNNLSKDRLFQRLLDLLYWLGIGLLIGSYIHLAYINRKPVVLNIYDSIDQREAELKGLSPNNNDTNITESNQNSEEN